MRIKNVGTTSWRGYDFDGTALSAEPGQEVEMSGIRAKAVLKDYPRRFVLVVDSPIVPVSVHRDDTSAGEVGIDVSKYPGRRRSRRDRGQ